MSLFSLGRTTHSRYTALDTHDKEQEAAPPPRRKPVLRYTSLALLVVSISLNALLLYKLSWSTYIPTPRFPQLLFSPAQDVVEYRVQKFTRGLAGDVPIYERPPSRDVDEAWTQLTIHAASKVPTSVAAQMPNRTWSIPEFEGYFLTSLDVFHQLHCLDMLRQSIHRDDYPNFHLSLVHLRHCIGAIRQALMCFSDVSTVTWQWNETRGEADQRDDVVHTCRNFEKIQEWAKENYYDNVPDLTNHVEWDLGV